MKMLAVAMGRRSGRHMDTRVAVDRTDVDQRASSKTVADKSSAGALEVQPKLVRGRSQQTCVVDARQRRFASGSCCSPMGGSRSCLSDRKESSGATADAGAGRHGSVKAHSARGRAS